MIQTCVDNVDTGEQEQCDSPRLMPSKGEWTLVTPVAIFAFIFVLPHYLTEHQQKKPKQAKAL